MKEQKELRLLGFHAENHRNIKVVELTPDLLNKKLIKVIGSEGSGKSSLLELIQTAIAGTDAIKSKSILESGYLTEVQLMDGDVKIWMGVKVRELTKGASKGENVVETFLYTKDADGKIEDYISDGVAWTAAQFVKEINTNLIFDTKSLYTENATEHRKLIEKLFAEDLAKLGAAAKVTEILASKASRDSARAACDSVGAFRENFEAEGWSETDLEELKPVNIDALRKSITELEVERGSLAKTADAKTELAKAEALAERTKKLQEIKDSARKVVEKIRVMTKGKEDTYNTAASAFRAKAQMVRIESDNHNALIETISGSAFLSEAEKSDIITVVDAAIARFEKNAKIGTAPVAPLLIQINELGVPEIPDEFDSDYEELVQERASMLESYHALNDMPLKFKTFEAGDTKELDAKIATLSEEIAKATKNNSVYERYKKWCLWIELKNVYESQVDELRKMYGGISTGVDGLKLVPVEESGRVNVWMEYSGDYDKTLFKDIYGKSTRLFELSGAQRGIVAVLLQAARLDLKKKALRLVILDAVPMTDLGIGILSRICEERNIQLITDQTWNSVPESDLDDHTIVVDNGELLFRGMNKKGQELEVSTNE